MKDQVNNLKTKLFFPLLRHVGSYNSWETVDFKKRNFNFPTMTMMNCSQDSGPLTGSLVEEQHQLTSGLRESATRRLKDTYMVLQNTFDTKQYMNRAE